MKENVIEQALRRKLEAFGCKCIKLISPGNSHVMDRMILRPKWSPGPPWVVECKRPGEKERRAQELTRQEWTLRGMRTLPPVSSQEEVAALADYIYRQCDESRSA